jgi:hypothetical protein
MSVLVISFEVQKRMKMTDENVSDYISVRSVISETCTVIVDKTDNLNLNVAIFWDTAQCNLYVNRHFGRTYRLHLQGRKSGEQETSV